MTERVDVSVVIPTLDGGAALERCLHAVTAQRTSRRVETLCIDSESSAENVAAMRRHPVRIHPIRRAEFDHGLTRDLGASLARGSVLVFLNQDAVPADALWLERLIEPLFESERWAAVQGGIRSRPPGECFYWDSTDARFYFTRDMRRWLERHGGIGFSTVNAAIRRSVWEAHPFGKVPFMEDKCWQARAARAGLELLKKPDAAVVHSHDYDLRAIVRRCRNEGMGWRLAGERYGFGDALADLAVPAAYRHLLRGIAAGRIRSVAELLYPWIRPIMLYVGNRLPREARS